MVDLEFLFLMILFTLATLATVELYERLMEK